tara:strand:+ start:1811 stop:1975 length:165 start_codon:yes stop_codon:yes gene_type:complete
MLRAVGDGEAGPFGERLDATLSLRQLFEERQPRWSGQCARDEGLFLEKGCLGAG